MITALARFGAVSVRTPNKQMFSTQQMESTGKTVGAPRATYAATMLRPVESFNTGAFYAFSQGKTGVELLTSLAQITKTGHHDLGYAIARDHLFNEISDPDNDDRVEDLFTGDSRPNIDGRKSAYERGMNTEHTWPQSHGATGIAQSDLHHLFPADIHTNERRGSLPYGDVTRPEWTIGEGVNQAKLGASAMGETVFEPRAEMKGDIARGLLYFYTRYNFDKPGDFTNRNLRTSLETLLKWAKEDPVSADESARNDAIQKVQGNRNPFVDHPEFIDLVGFQEGGFSKIQSSGYSFFILNETTRDYAEVIYEA